MFIFDWRSRRAAAAAAAKAPGAGNDLASKTLYCAVTVAEAQFVTFCFGLTFRRTRSLCCLSAALRSVKLPLKRSVAQASFPS